MPLNRRIRTAAISLTIILLLLAAGYLVLIEMIDLENYRGQIIAELQKKLNRPVSYKNIKLTFSLGPAISLHGIMVKEPDSTKDFLTIENLAFRLDLLPLFRRQLVVHGLVADKAVIRIERHSDGKFNISDLLESSETQEMPVILNQFKLTGAEISFFDSFNQQKPLLTRFADTDLYLEHLSRGSKGRFQLLTHLQGGASGTIAINGRIKVAPKGSPLGSSKADIEISAKGFETAGFWPYYSKFVPFRKLAGTVDAEAEINGQLEEFTSTGKITLHDGQLDYQPVFKKLLTSKAIRLKYSMELNKADIILKAVEANVDGADIKGSCAIRGYRGEDPRITAQAVTSRLEYAKLSQYIPYGIIVKDTADWIEQHLAGGVYQLDEGRLDGNISQILHMETGQNYNVLYIKARVEQGIIRYGSSVPTFNNIKGTLEIKGKDFSLHGMSAKFGNSPLTLEGKIADYALDKPSSYPFKMVISPAKSELDWLLGKEQSKKLFYNGNSALTLVGEGITSAYNLSGDWNLTPAAYSYSNFVTKPVGTPSQVKFKGSISPKETVLTSLNYTLAGLNVAISAKYPFEPDKARELLINTNQFSIQTLAPMSPFLTGYQPTGRVQLSLLGTLAPPDKGFKWRGALVLNNASILYSPDKKPVSALTGTIRFSDDAVESSQISAKIGATDFRGTAAISSFNPVAVHASFTSPRIDLADFGFKHPEKNPQITKVSGDVSFRDNSLTIKKLSGDLNNSKLSVTGAINDIDLLKADLAITASHLDIADLIILGEINPVSAKSVKPLPDPTIKASIKADKCTFSDIEFEKLAAKTTLANKSLLIEHLESNFGGGKLTATGKIDFTSALPHYQTEFKLAKASADKISRLISSESAKKEITGSMTLTGDIRATGNTAAALKKSVSGSIKVHSEKGMLRQFSMLSKVFSILNVSQLFKFRLPDMVSEGMPYTRIDGNLAIKDGIVSTDDLFVASNAMNISIVGKNDFINDKLDLTLGIQPLQTVDKVVSHIPVVGWILTGENKAMFSTYFEIKGKSGDPDVSAIPITSLGKGVLGIFKRVFQLPVKLFTDTGEVILGN